MNKKFKILSHLADVKIQIFGKNEKELFLNALLAMAEIQKGEISGEKKKRQVKVQSVDLNGLLVDFLNEVLYLSQVNKEIYSDIEFEKFSDKELKGTLFGQKVKSLGEDIKAVTYYDLKIKHEEDKSWTAAVIFDI